MTSLQRVLVVEDEPLIAMMLEDFLDVLGKLAVATVDSVATALAALDVEQVDAAILDVHLRGGEKSTAVAEALAARNIPFVFASGGNGDGIDDRFHDRPRLQKPFTMDGVEKALAEL
ncbi:response regulator [Sphingomonas oligophenolica]|uniref:Response regulator n=1 Tax=Sphingomonas oligophenolica TaxID=301154 RepID=A0A502CS60_9SPHN|nr:response regulator [Sphingomonas oligophenolica]TPG14551.1 response regulator [Sphingomonas oligophenolica]